MKTVYLAGPISGRSYANAQGWRDRMASRLLPAIKCIQPMFGESSLKTKDKPLEYYPDSLMSSPRACTIKDRFYVKNADMIYARFFGATAISKGTIGECFWANAWDKPIVLGMEKSGNPNDHAMLREIAGWVVEDDEDAEAVIRGLLEAI